MTTLRAPVVLEVREEIKSRLCVVARRVGCWGRASGSTDVEAGGS